jgi:DNA-binding IclR family transcriptional regulator
LSQSSPGAIRVVAIINFFAEHPGQAFTFTEIVRALKMGKATCHSLLTSLLEAQYLYRNRDKTYVIGPALVAIARIAARQFSPLQAAEPEIRALADEFGAVCSVIALDKDHAMIKARAGTVSDFGWAPRHAARLPLRATSVAPFFAWSSASEKEEWLSQLEPEPSAAQRAQLLEGIDFTLQHGFAFGVRDADVVLDPDATSQTITLMVSLDPKASYHTAYIVAPVFDSLGKVVFVLSLSGIPGAVSGKKIAEMGSALISACARITAFIAGAQTV